MFILADTFGVHEYMTQTAVFQEKSSAHVVTDNLIFSEFPARGLHLEQH